VPVTVSNRWIQYIDKVIISIISIGGRPQQSRHLTAPSALSASFLQRTGCQGARERQGRFSFNVKGGVARLVTVKCLSEIEMQFLPDVTVPGEVARSPKQRSPENPI
jgi:excinuclease ABC subunit A